MSGQGRGGGRNVHLGVWRASVTATHGPLSREGRGCSFVRQKRGICRMSVCGKAYYSYTKGRKQVRYKEAADVKPQSVRDWFW